MHVHLNMACSLDGRVAGKDGDPIQLSSPEDHARVHGLRATTDAVLVGVDTVINDDPLLTARTDPPPRTQPSRVVLDTDLRTPSKARILDDQAATFIITGSPPEDPIGGATVIPVGDPITPRNALEALKARGLDDVLIEGGPTVASSFLEASLVDRFTLYIAPWLQGEGPSLWSALRGIDTDLTPRARGPMGEGTLVSYGVPP